MICNQSVADFEIPLNTETRRPGIVKTNYGKSPIILSTLAFFVLTLPLVFAVSAKEDSSSAGAVFIMTNSAAGNRVLAYGRGADGSLSFSGSFPTNGLGTGSGLGDQGGLALSQGGRWLLAVNAGSNDVTVFRVGDESAALTLTDKVSSSGKTPISVTIHEESVYVLNAGNTATPANIAGFRLSEEGGLSPISGSVEPLSGVTSPAEISFNPHGTVLIVTEKTTNIIDAYTVDEDGVAASPVTNLSHGTEPFGFAFDNSGNLIVSEAVSGALSSYAVSETGHLTTVSGSVADGQKAACWVAVTRNGHFSYTTNTASGTISSYAVGERGALTLLRSVAATTHAGPLDMALSRNGRFLYVFESGTHEIQGFSVGADGSLSWLSTVSGIPAGAAGLAAN